MSRWSNSIEHARIQIALSTSVRVLVWVYAFVAMVCLLAFPVGKFDDAIPLVHATLITQGFTPNIDFFSFYPPLGLYWTAAAFKLLGQTVIATRVAASLLFGIVLLLVSWFFRHRFRSDAFVPGALLLVAVTIGTAILMPSWPGFAVSLSALLIYLRSREENRNRLGLVALSGVLAGAAILFRINFGAYVVFVIALDFARRALLDGIGDFRSRVKTEATAAAAFMLPLIGFCAGVGLWIFGSRIGTAVGEFVLSAQRLMAVRGFLDLRLDTSLACAITLPFFWFHIRVLKESSTFSIKAIVPAVSGVAVLALALAGGKHYSIAALVVVIEVVMVLFMHVFIRRVDPAELGLLLFYCCLLHYYISRADSAHVRFLPIAAALLVPFLVLVPDRLEKERFGTAMSRGTALSILVVSIFVVVSTPEFRPGLSAFPKGLALISSVLRDGHSTDGERVLGTSPPSQAWAVLYSDLDELAALRYLRARTDPSTPLFVGYLDHSRVFWNDLRMYWLADRPIAVRMFQLETRVATETPVQREIVADLENSRKAWIILDSEFVGDSASIKANYQGSRLLDDYISRHFKKVETFGSYSILTRATD